MLFFVKFTLACILVIFSKKISLIKNFFKKQLH